MNSPQQQQPRSYPDPPKVSRPASVQLEPSMAFQAQQDENTINTTRPRSQSHTGYSSYVPPPSSSASSPTLLSSASSSSSTSSSSSSNNTTSHENSSDNPVRFQNWSQPAHKSKLSMQYTPSEEDSDEESRPKTQTRQRRSKFMSGAALELNTNSAENLRALSQMSISEKPSKPLPPSVSDITDSMSVKSSKKKMSLGKRISRFFGGGNSKSNDGSSSPISTKSSASSIHGSEKSAFRSSSTSLAPIDELTPPSPVAHNPLYNHQRSFSTPDQIGKITSNSSPVSSKPENQLLRTARDSSSQDSEGRDHRRYSSTITAMPRASHSRSSPQMVQSTAHNPNNSKSGNRSSTYKNESVYIDHHQQQQQLQQQQAAHQSRRSTLGAGSSPQLRPHPELLQRPPSRDNHRHSSFGAEMVNQGSSSLSPLAPPTQRRGSTPLPGSEPLIARVDRERASVCFQAPTPKKEPTKEKETNMDPVITNLAHQHRKDFRTNHRLGGTSQPPAHQQQHSPQMYPNSPRMRTNSYERQTRDPNLRCESNASQHYYHIDGTATSSPKLLPLSYPPSPGLYAESQMGRASTSSQQGQHPYISAGQRMNFNGSQGSLHQYQSPNQSQSHLQGGQSSPSVGPQRTSPKRISSAGYFTLPSQQYPQTDSQYTPPPPVLRESPLPSPNFGAVQGGNLQQIPELSLQQQQKQLDQLHQIRVQQQQQIAIQKQQQVQLQRQLQQQQVGLGLGVVPMQAMPVPMTMGVTPQAINMNMPMVLAPTYMQQAHHHHHHPQSTMAAVYSYPSNVPVAAAGYQ